LDAKTKFLRKFSGSPHYSDRQLVLFAVMIAVCANSIFWGLLFKYRVQEAAVRDNSSSLELLDLNPPDAGHCRRWISYHDPAKSGSSAYPGGFSAQLPRRELVEPPEERPRHTSGIKVPEVRKVQPLAVSDRNPIAVLSLPRAMPSTVRGTPLALPLATDDRGRDIAVSAAALPKRGMPVTSDTMLLATSAGGKMNLIVCGTCGDPVLDGRAAGLVAAAVDKLDPPPAYVVVRWPQRFASDEVKKPTGE